MSGKRSAKVVHTQQCPHCEQQITVTVRVQVTKCGRTVKPPPESSCGKGNYCGKCDKCKKRRKRYTDTVKPVVELLEKRDESGRLLTMAEIGRRTGVTTEWVRRIAKRELGQTGKDRREAQPPKWRYENGIPRNTFVRFVREWLERIGCCYCPTCHKAVNHEDMTKINNRNPVRCKACTAKVTRRWYRSPDGKKKAREWQKNNPEKLAEYMNRWKAKNPEKVRSYNRKNSRRRAGWGEEHLDLPPMHDKHESAKIRGVDNT